MPGRTCLVITSVAEPTRLLRELADGALEHDVDLIVIGDRKSPTGFALRGCDYYSLERQQALGLAFADCCPTGHYARKNIGFLIAMRRRAGTIVETDDDTVAYASFWRRPTHTRRARRPSSAGWVNAYRYFSHSLIWPRGFPLDEAQRPVPRLEPGLVEVTSPIQQALIDDDPDVDAVYRLVFPLPFRFDAGPSIALPPGAWCPFNSQNTTWWPEAFPLMYLPATCSFRMTDIWRSFVAQRLAWANGWEVLFHRATIRQARNAHETMSDFRQEIPGYLDNKRIAEALDELELERGAASIPRNLRLAYERLVAGGFLDACELPLLDAWLADVASVSQPPVDLVVA